MLNIDVKIDGIEGVTAALEDAFGDLEPAIMQGVKQAALIVQGAAKNLAPRDTGELINSIVVNGPAKSGDAVSAEVVATAEHALYVEMGTGERGASSTLPDGMAPASSYATGHPGMAAQPYMFPAYQAKKEAASKAIAAAVKKAVGG